MACEVGSHPWSVAALLAKAKLYTEKMHNPALDRGESALWSAIVLELLARAALAHISPILLADEKNWRNLAFALGKSATSKKFSPVSIGIKEVLVRLNELEPKVTQEVVDFCAVHFDKRNAELHSGELSFSTYESSGWLPRFYQAAEAFLSTMGQPVEEFFQAEKNVRLLIDSLGDKAAQAVRSEISAHQTVWGGKSEADRETLTKQAEVWASRHSGHRVKCPACLSPALLYGTPSGPVTTSINGDEIEQKQANIPSSFECVACGLRISGFSKLAACGLGNAFTATTAYSASEFFGLYSAEELNSAVEQAEKDALDGAYEPDYNE